MEVAILTILLVLGCVVWCAVKPTEELPTDEELLAQWGLDDDEDD